MINERGVDMTNELKQAFLPVSEWGEGVAVSLPTVARRWGLSEAETHEMFDLIPTIGHDPLDDGEVRIRIAETGEWLWIASNILFAERDMPELANGRGHEVLEALRALKSAVEGIDEPDMFNEVIHRMGCKHVSMTAEKLTTLANLEPSALRSELEPYGIL